MNDEVTMREAAETLRDLQRVEAKARDLVFAGFAAFPMMLWGVLWVICFLLGYCYTKAGWSISGLHPDRLAGWLTKGGLVVTFAFIAWKLWRSNPIRSTGTWFEQFRAPLLVVVWFAFHFSTSGLHDYDSGRAMNAFNVSYWMLLYVVYGFWFANRIFITVGILISGFAMTGYYFLGDHYGLWMALLGGGTLFGGGLRAKLKCRSAKRIGDA